MNFHKARQKALRSLEIGRYGLGADGKDDLTFERTTDADVTERKCDITKILRTPRSNNIFFLRQALRLGMTIDKLYEITKIDRWFLHNIRRLVELEEELKSTGMETITSDALLKTKQFGFSDRQLAFIWKTDELHVRQIRKRLGVLPVFKTVDTCAAEFEAQTPYHCSTYETENEVTIHARKEVVILGGGPNRIGQGIEFDYCCVHGVFAVKELGYNTIMINCNPETVSTDYDKADKLYFEPLTLENILDICEAEKPKGVIVSFGGQTPLNLAKALESSGMRILGTSSEGIGIAEDHQRFGELLEKLRIPHPEDGAAVSVETAKTVAAAIGYPVLVRPSYVLGGRGMQIIYNLETLEEYMKAAVEISPDHPILIDKFLENAREFDVDAVCDGKDVLIGGVLQHIEEAGIHSGDSACVLMPYAESVQIVEQLREFTRKLSLALEVRGLVNVQCAEKDGIVYVLEVNPRASRTVPFISKAMGLSLAKTAAKVMVGKTLGELGVPLSATPKYIAVKESVFPFGKFPKAKVYLRPEMRSTGEVMAIADTFGEALSKAFIGASEKLLIHGGVFVSVNDNDKNYKTIEVAKGFARLGFQVFATSGTSAYLKERTVENTAVYKVNEGRPNIVDFIKNGDIDLVVNTPLGESSRFDELSIGSAALEAKLPIITTIAAAAAVVKGIEWLRRQHSGVKSLQEYHDAAAMER